MCTSKPKIGQLICLILRNGINELRNLVSIDEISIVMTKWLTQRFLASKSRPYPICVQSVSVIPNKKSNVLSVHSL